MQAGYVMCAFMQCSVAALSVSCFVSDIFVKNCNFLYPTSKLWIGETLIRFVVMFCMC